MAALLVRGGDELRAVTDPLEAEAWASAMMGRFYKVDAPLDARDELERRIWPAVMHEAEAARDAGGLAVLEALAAVADEGLAADARAAADRIRALGVPPPAWAAEIGSAVFESAWVLLDVFGDHEGYYASFRYPGRKPHVVNALYDKAMGNIVKDSFAGYLAGDPRSSLPLEPGVWVEDAEPGVMARRVLDAVANGDLYLDNDWSPEFKQTRALLLARMRLLRTIPATEPPEPLEDEARDALVAEFLASALPNDGPEAGAIARDCLAYSCDYLGEDPFRWSPIVVEQFLLDYLPRKVSLDMSEIRELPRVLRAWVRFALTKRGLAERWIAETEESVGRWKKDFRRAMTDQRQFGPAKTIGNAMVADGVDLSDQAAIDRWLESFNARPMSERDELLGDRR